MQMDKENKRKVFFLFFRGHFKPIQNNNNNKKMLFYVHIFVLHCMLVVRQSRSLWEFKPRFTQWSFSPKITPRVEN